MAHEIMENDNMFSVGETPWHGLGIVLPDAPGIDEALIYSGLDWVVRVLDLTAKQPVDKAMTGQFQRTIVPIDRFKALQRADTGEVFTVVSDQYKVLQNYQAFDIFRPLVDNGDLRLETAGSLQNGRKVWILAEITTTGQQEVNDGDIIRPFVLLSNSHDGSQAVRMGFTPVRVVCNNTLSMAVTNSESKLVKVYHRGDVQGNLTLIRNAMELGTAQFKARIEDYRLMAKKEISQADLRKYLRIILEVPEEVPLDVISRNEKAIMAVLEGGKGLGVRANGPTVWDAYNAVNEWGLYHRGGQQDRRLASAWFGEQYKMDLRAFDVALEMAKAA